MTDDPDITKLRHATRSHGLYDLSGTFGPAADLETATRQPISQAWIVEFNDYVFRTYGEKGSPGCGYDPSVDTASKAEARFREAEKSIRQNNGKFIETGWIPTHLQ